MEAAGVVDRAAAWTSATTAERGALLQKAGWSIVNGKPSLSAERVMRTPWDKLTQSQRDRLSAARDTNTTTAAGDSKTVADEGKGATPGTGKAETPQGNSKQFDAYKKAIDAAETVGGGMVEQIRGDERLNDGEAEKLAALAQPKMRKTLADRREAAKTLAPKVIGKNIHGDEITADHRGVRTVNGQQQSVQIRPTRDGMKIAVEHKGEDQTAEEVDAARTPAERAALERMRVPSPYGKPWPYPTLGGKNAPAGLHDGQRAVVDYMNGDIDKPAMMKQLASGPLQEGQLWSITNRLKNDFVQSDRNALEAMRATILVTRRSIP